MRQCPLLAGSVRCTSESRRSGLGRGLLQMTLSGRSHVNREWPLSGLSGRSADGRPWTGLSNKNTFVADQLPQPKRDVVRHRALLREAYHAQSVEDAFSRCLCPQESIRSGCRQDLTFIDEEIVSLRP